MLPEIHDRSRMAIGFSHTRFRAGADDSFLKIHFFT